MAKIERRREMVSEIPSAEEIQRRQEQGWKLAAIEWQREGQDESRQEASTDFTPYGLTTHQGETSLRVDPREEEVMRLILGLVVDDRNSMETVADELNRRGHRTRQGESWSAIAVFNMMPRLVELAPRLFEPGAGTAGSAVVH